MLDSSWLRPEGGLGRSATRLPEKPIWQQEVNHYQHDCIRGPGRAIHWFPPLPQLSVSRIVTWISDTGRPSLSRFAAPLRDGLEVFGFGAAAGRTERVLAAGRPEAPAERSERG